MSTVANSLVLSRGPAKWVFGDIFSRRRFIALAAALSADLSGNSRPAAAQPAVQASTTINPPGHFKRDYADGPYGQVHYRHAGDGRYAGAESGKPPLLCLHPSPLSGIVYENWLVEMGRDRYALAPDTPGYGGSDAPPGPPQIADYAHAMLRFLDANRLDVVDVMGYHTGSLISVEMARQEPARVRRVVMISAPLPDAKAIADYTTMINAPPQTFEELLSTTLDRIRRVGRGLFRDTSDDRYWDITLERMRRFRTSPWGFRAAFNYDLSKTLPLIDQPILVLNPEDDLWDQTPKARQYLRNGQIHDLPGWTHGHLDSHTQEMAAIVRAFLDT
jgi:pimeloyl-ACP methyl ester carboxylesterase